MQGPLPGARQLLMFRVEASLYALPIALVDHVSLLPPIVPVPTAPAHFAGVVHERGRVLAVVDLARIFAAGGERARRGYRRLVVVELRGRSLAILAHDVPGLREIAGDEVRPGSGRGEVAAGQFEDARGVVTLLDPDELLRALRAAPEARHAS